MSKNELSEEEYNKYLKTVEPCTIDDITVDDKVTTRKLLAIPKVKKPKYVRVSFRNLSIEESQLMMQYENTKEDNYIYYRHLIFLLSVEPKFEGYEEKNFVNTDWKFVKEYVRIINDHNRDNAFLSIRQEVLPEE